MNSNKSFHQIELVSYKLLMQQLPKCTLEKQLFFVHEMVFVWIRVHRSKWLLNWRFSTSLSQLNSILYRSIKSTVSIWSHAWEKLFDRFLQTFNFSCYVYTMLRSHRFSDLDMFVTVYSASGSYHFIIWIHFCIYSWKMNGQVNFKCELLKSVGFRGPHYRRKRRNIFDVADYFEF